MKYLLINVVCGIKSTGRICTDLASELEKQGHEVKIAYGREEVPDEYKRFAYRIGNDFDVMMHALQSRLFDNNGLCSKRVTKRFIEWVKNYNPDVIHLHNIHGYYINYEILFNYLKTCGKEIKWTLHDCWAFTGRCSHYTYIGCDKWKTQCDNCPQKDHYPKTLIDRSKSNYELKKECFTEVPNLKLIVPSNWLKKEVSNCFLREYQVNIIHNTIDTNIFKPTPSNFREKNNIQDKKIILGVAYPWDKRKGIEDFMELSKVIGNDKYQIVMVGLTKKQIQKMPDNIICIEKTNSKKELAEIYSAADIFFNPTKEDNYPTVNLEAEACGAKVITYDVGGSPESAGKSAIVIKNVNDLSKIIKGISYEKN